MNHMINTTVWAQYLEITPTRNAPVKLDRILAARLETFRKSRRVQPLSSAETSDV